jgi:hypothetical protein
MKKAMFGSTIMNKFDNKADLCMYFIASRFVAAAHISIWHGPIHSDSRLKEVVR